MTDEFKDVERLNEATYRLNGRLESNKETLSKEIYDIVKEDLIALYEDSRREIHNRYDVDHKREEFEHRERSATLVPRAWRFLFLHGENVAAKLITEAVNISTDEFFSEQEAANDENRPEYMPKIYLTRAQKREAKREAHRERKAEREKKKRLRKLERDRKDKARKERKRAARDVALEARKKRREARRAERLRRTAERAKMRKDRRIKDRKRKAALRKQRQERRKKTTSPKFPKTGTESARSSRTFSTPIPKIGDISPNVCMEKSPSKGKEKKT